MASGSRAALAAALVTCVAGSARADVLDDIGKKLVTVEGEARELGSGIKKPTGQPKKDDVLSRRLIDAQVAFGVGNYDNAALLLYDYVAQATRGRDYDTALYYLGESLFQKNDRVAAPLVLHPARQGRARLEVLPAGPRAPARAVAAPRGHRGRRRLARRSRPRAVGQAPAVGALRPRQVRLRAERLRRRRGLVQAGAGRLRVRLPGRSTTSAPPTSP
jgi:hypothetical protein